MKRCRFIRMLGNLFPETEGWWNRWLEGHAARCADCRETLERERELIQSLRRSAPPPATDMPPFLKRRILSDLERPGASAGAWAGADWRWLRPWAVAGGCLALLVAFWPGHDLPVTDSGDSGSAPIAGAAVPALPAPTWLTGPADVLGWAKLASDPLHGEFANAVDDGRRLFAAAVQSVVPDDTAKAILAHTESWLPAVNR